MNKEELFFNMYKDTVVVSKKFKNDMKTLYGFSAREADDLFVKINHYQIKKYGGRLELDKDSKFSKDEVNHQNRLSRQRKYYAKNREV